MERDYDVCLYYHGLLDIRVKAEDARQAKEKALKQAERMAKLKFVSRLMQSLESDLELSTAEEVE